MNEAPPSGPDGSPTRPWYHSAHDSVQGPISREELLRLLARGTIPRSALVWRPGMADWTPARRVSELAGLLPPRVEEDEDDAMPTPESTASGDEPRAGAGLSAWGPVAAAATVVLAAGLGIWTLGSEGGRAAGTAAPDGASGGGAAVELGDLSGAHARVGRNHVAALADSLDRLQVGDSLESLLRQAGGLEWTRRVGFAGLHRLPDRPVVEHAELMGKALRAAPEELCSAVARWRASSGQYWTLLSGLSAEEMRRLLEILRAGVMAELRDRSPLPEPGAGEVSEAFSMLGDRMPETSRDSLLRVLSPAASPTASESCWAERTLYGGVLRIPDPWRAVLARAAVTG